MSGVREHSGGNRASRRTQRSSAPHADAGPRGRAVAPPPCGIGFVDGPGASGPVVQRLIGFEFETKCELLPGDKESKPQKDEKLLAGNQWELAAEVVDADANRVAEFKTRALDDQDDPAAMKDLMDGMEDAVANIAMRGETPLNGLAAYGAVQEAHKNTTIKRGPAIVTARPQVTGGISAARILNLLADMGSATPASRKDLVPAAANTDSEKVFEKTARLVSTKLGGEPPEYQSFVALMAVYITMAQIHPVEKYFKAIIPVLSRMDLGGFMKIKEVVERKGQAAKDLSTILGAGLDLNGLLFPSGVYDKKKNAMVMEGVPKIAEWIDAVLAGADPVPWSLNVNQEGKAFGLEAVGAPQASNTRAPGVPIELRTLASVPFYEWKPLAVHFFRYIRQLNDLGKQPTAFKGVAEGMSEHEAGVHKEMVKYYQTLLANK